MKRVTILGATGSIGTQALDVISRNKEEFRVTALTAENNIDLLVEQANLYHPKAVAFTGSIKNVKLESSLPQGTKVFYGEPGLKDICTDIETDIVLISVVGIAGLTALETCIKNGIQVALANKEALVCGGRVIRDLLNQKQAKLHPVDSELSAIFQCLNNGYETESVRRIILTASGGPFRQWKKNEIEQATVKDALNHPNWNMGAKVTVDSATLMNKGLETMETRWLFDVPPEKIDVIIHEKSIVHSMVEFTDGSIIAQMGVTDMRQPIQYALGYPKRYSAPAGFLDITAQPLAFYPPDIDKFPCLKLALEALKDDGGASAVVLNAANEIAVQRFLKEEFLLGGIARIVEKAMDKFTGMKINSVSEIIETDRQVRKYALNL